MCLLIKKLVDLNNIQGQCRMNIQDEDTFAGIVLPYLNKLKQVIAKHPVIVVVVKRLGTVLRKTFKL